jgi:hypothetical protein
VTGLATGKNPSMLPFTAQGTQIPARSRLRLRSAPLARGLVTLEGLDPPTYLHDGRLLTIEDTVELFNLVLGTKLSEQEKLVALMRQL